MPRGSIQNLFTDRTRSGALAAPSILAADFGRMADECAAAIGAGADVLHVDIMDGHFVDNLTMGPDMVKGIRKVLPTAFLDVHLMVTNPERFAEPFVRAGANHVTFHVEVAEHRALVDLAERVRGMGATAGIAINPPTPVERLWPAIEAFDLVLVMSVNPGRGGQAFIPETLEKTRLARERVGAFAKSGVRVEMDGGIGPQNAKALREAGCDVLVAGSAFFGKPRSEWPALAAQIRG